MDFYDDMDSDLMRQIQTLHPEFIEAVNSACVAFESLLSALDNNGTLPDIAIERIHGNEALEAFKRADRAYQNLVVFFLDETGE